MINVKDYRKLSVDAIYDDIKGDIDKIYDDYSFVDIDINTFDSLNKKFIKSFDVENKDIKDNVNPYLVSYLSKRYKVFIGMQVNQNGREDYIFKALPKYFNDETKGDVKSFKMFCKFINDCKINLSYELVKSLFQNQILHDTLSSLVNNNKYKLQTASYEFDTEAENLILNSFLEYEDIELEEENINDKSYDDSIAIYFKQATHKVLTREEEVELAIKCTTGTELERKKARKQFAEYNLRLVINIAKKYQGRGLEFGDLIGFGNLGLMKAIDKFDVGRGFKFATFATFWIKQSIIRGIGDTGRNIRIPIHTLDKINKVKSAMKEFTRKNDYEPQATDIANMLNWNLNEVEELMNLTNDTISMNSRVGEEDETELGDFIPDQTAVNPEEQAIENFEKDLLGKILEYAYKCRQNGDTLTISKGLTLDSREIAVFVLRNGLILPTKYEYLVGDVEYIKGREYTLEAVGDMFGITRERIRQIESKTLRKVQRLAELFKQGRLFKNTPIRVSRTTTLYEELKEYTKEDIDCAVLALDKSYKEVLLNRANPEYEWKELDEKKFREKVLPEIVNLITSKKEDIDFLSSSKLEQELLTNDVYNMIMFGNFNTCDLLTRHAITKIYEGKLFNSIYKNCDDFTARLISLRFTKENNKYRTLNEIASILEISELEVSSELGKFLRSYKDSMNNILKLFKK
jgi:RNA polymerase primary sigma factor